MNIFNWKPSSQNPFHASYLHQIPLNWHKMQQVRHVTQKIHLRHLDLTITESLRLEQMPQQPIPWSKKGKLMQPSLYSLQFGFHYLQGWRLHKLSISPF